VSETLRVLYLEPFNGGSHERFTKRLTATPQVQWTVLTLPGRHWKWRMRGFSAYAATHCARELDQSYDVVFASSYVALAELYGLCPHLSRVPSLLYFHENQLAYPDRSPNRERDHHFGVTQMVSALAATKVAFNSQHNRDSFLAGAAALLANMPDFVPAGWVDRIAERSLVVPVPLELRDEPPTIERCQVKSGPLVVWNHRWEHDKNPEAFFLALGELSARGILFRLAVCGQRFRREPAIFAEAHARLRKHIVHWGQLQKRCDYEALLGRADIVVSTAVHEFFGVAMLEATHLGALPLVPDRLAYPELFGREFLYENDRDLVERLAAACERYAAGTPLRADRRFLTRPFLATAVVPRYLALLRELARGGAATPCV
jgi:glycosyltransferase involved in cell wall biosynthesis